MLLLILPLPFLACQDFSGSCLPPNWHPLTPSRQPNPPHLDHANSQRSSSRNNPIRACTSTGRWRRSLAADGQKLGLLAAQVRWFSNDRPIPGRFPPFPCGHPTSQPAGSRGTALGAGQPPPPSRAYSVPTYILPSAQWICSRVCVRARGRACLVETVSAAVRHGNTGEAISFWF